MQKYYIVGSIIGIALIGYLFWGGIPEPQEQSKSEQSLPEVTLAVPGADVTVTEQKPQQKNTPIMNTAKIETTMGVITLTLNREQTPKTVENFVKLAQSGFYDGTRFHRVIAGFMIQGGDPLTKDLSMAGRWGTGGPGYAFADEIGSSNHNNVGTIAMANAGPNTNGSQFFINVNDNNFLDTKHTVFGVVTGGMDVVHAIENTPTSAGDRPVKDVVVTKVTVSE